MEKTDKVEVASAINALRRGARSIESVYQQFCVKMEMELHQFCELFPLATKRELDGMAGSIRDIGLKEPIVLYEGRILDGKNRFIACNMAGVEPRYVEYAKEKYGDPLQFVISKNFYRSNLKESQYADLSDKLKDIDALKQMIENATAKQEQDKPKKELF